MALVVEIKVIPSSGRQKFVLEESGKLKCFLKSTPERGQANSELIQILAKKLLILKRDISVIFGKTTRNKKVKIDIDITYDDFLKKLVVKDKRL